MTRLRLEPGGISALDRAAWDALGGGDPLLAHRFLALLEQSGSVGPGTGWQALPLLIEQGGALIGAAPLYAKAHSQGEYVFDHGWAEAFDRAGGAYYPKFQVAVPFTPCPGVRLLGARAPLIAALEEVTRAQGLSSAHVTFCTEAEAAALAAAGWLLRDGLQYHWHNQGYADFEAFLAALNSRKRKAIRRERAAAIQGLHIETLRGAAIDAAVWDAMWAFYQDTGARKWGRPYLTRAWFDRAGAVLGEAALIVLARRQDDGVAIAGALNIIGGDTLYGRYWGAVEERPFLHFELSYYRAIEWAIDHGIATIQAGAQGEHKLARGYAPVLTRSAHFIPHPGFRAAVADFVARERVAVAAERAAMQAELPYRHKY